MDFKSLTVFHSSLMLIDKRHVAPRLSLTNATTLNYLLRSEIFLSEDKQLRVVHLILDFKPLSDKFQEVGNAIRAADYRINQIDVSWPNFLALYDLPPISHPVPQGVPLVVLPI